MRNQESAERVWRQGQEAGAMPHLLLCLFHAARSKNVRADSARLGTGSSGPCASQSQNHREEARRHSQPDGCPELVERRAGGKEQVYHQPNRQRVILRRVVHGFFVNEGGRNEGEYDRRS